MKEKKNKISEHTKHTRKKREEKEEEANTQVLKKQTTQERTRKNQSKINK